ncbi:MULTISPECIES: hypothetical protein [unclassified Spirosoma]|uniref:hypothetical protein n=1 Tax=unclassified Spirosoma TaxID=2621999 RepID=UPI0009690E92|nr:MULTISPECIES: hypothetical protein [unclassified Spirosoma]MBN8824467.1 hypothetical protein [Spirosoma sp.]OJW70069.1 MAG: hypothetical protein BGO59_25685 [Spirosoma sp. 48-14]
MENQPHEKTEWQLKYPETYILTAKQTEQAMIAAVKALIAKAAEHGFTNEEDEEEGGKPERFLFCVDKNEIARIILPCNYWKAYNTNLHIIFDRLLLSPYTFDTVSECKRSTFYTGTLDITDLDFFEKLLLSIFPKPVSPTPY